MTKRFDSFFYDFLQLDEGLTRTYSKEKLLQFLEKKYKKFISPKSFKRPTDYDAYSPNIKLTITSDAIPFGEFKKDIGLFGYFIGRQYDNSHSSYGDIWLLPKFNENQNTETLPSVVYHYAPKSVLHKIEKIGLIPRESTKPDWNHPGDRTYVFAFNFPVKLDEYEFKYSIGGVLDNIARSNNKMMDDYVIIKISTNGMKSSDFYIDPSLPKTRSYKTSNIYNILYGLYTSKNISPNKFIKIMSFNGLLKDYFEEQLKHFDSLKNK